MGWPMCAARIYGNGSVMDWIYEEVSRGCPFFGPKGQLFVQLGLKALVVDCGRDPSPNGATIPIVARLV